MHCAKNNLNLRIKATLQRREQMQRYMSDFLEYTAIAGPGIRLAYCTSVLYHCISSNRDRHGYYAEIQIIFGTVCWHQQLSWCGFLHTRQVHDARDAFTLAEAFFTDASAYTVWWSDLAFF